MLSVMLQLSSWKLDEQAACMDHKEFDDDDDDQLSQQSSSHCSPSQHPHHSDPVYMSASEVI